MIAAVYARKSRTALTLAVLLTGCAPTLAEVRSGPAQTATFPGQYDTFALCLLDKLDSQRGFTNNLTMVTTRHVDRRSEQTATLTASGAQWGLQGPLAFEIRALQATPSMVRVELRNARAPIGIMNDFGPSLWPLVDACADEKVVTSPPRQK
jgi:hypothetical protein